MTGAKRCLSWGKQKEEEEGMQSENYLEKSAAGCSGFPLCYFMITLGSQVAIPGTSVIKTVMAI